MGLLVDGFYKASMSYHSNGWGIIGLFGGMALTMLAPYFDAHPTVRYIAAFVGVCGVIGGIGCLVWPRFVALYYGILKRQIPLSDALRKAYTECERTPYGRFIANRHSDPDKRLQFLFDALTSAKGVRLFAKHPPSTERRQVDCDEGLSWVPGTNDIRAVFADHSYNDAIMKMSELRAAIRELRNINPG